MHTRGHEKIPRQPFVNCKSPLSICGESISLRKKSRRQTCKIVSVNQQFRSDSRHQISLLSLFRPIFRKTFAAPFCQLNVAELRNAFTFASDL